LSWISFLMGIAESEAELGKLRRTCRIGKNADLFWPGSRSRGAIRHSTSLLKIDDLYLNTKLCINHGRDRKVFVQRWAPPCPNYWMAVTLPVVGIACLCSWSFPLSAPRPTIPTKAHAMAAARLNVVPALGCDEFVTW
jgi:hypothetical protein